MRPRFLQEQLGCSALGLALALTAPLALADSYDEQEEEETGEADDARAEDAAGPPVEPASEALTAGGLQAPASLGDELKEQSQAEQDLEEADRRDSQRGLEFAWVSAALGLGAYDAALLNRGELLATGDSSGGGGFVFGAGLGMRVLYFTLGARFRVADVSAFRIWSLGGEAGLKVPMGNLEPFATLDLGYAGLDGLSATPSSSGLVGVGGPALGLGIGADYYFSDYFSLGASVGANLLFLSRPAQTPAGLPALADPVYAVPASSIGAGMSATLLVGFHL